MEKKLIYTQGLKGIQRNKPSAFTTLDTFDEARMAVLEAGGLYKIRKPLPSVYNSNDDTYVPVENVTNLRPRGMAYVPSTVPAVIFWYGDKCFKVNPISNISDRVRFDKSNVSLLWSGEGDPDGKKYKWELFIDSSDNDYLFCCAGGALKYIKLSDFSTGTVPVLPATGCNSICLNNRRLWCLIGDKLYYSEVDNGLSFNLSNFLRLFENDVGYETKVYDNVIFTFTDKKIYYITGNSTDDFKVKAMEDTQVIDDCTFDADAEGIYFMDKYANIRLIGSNPYYNAASRSLIISQNLNLYDKFVAKDLKYPTSINIARNQDKIFVNVGVSSDFSTSTGSIDATKDSDTDFLVSSVWSQSSDHWSITATEIYRETMSVPVTSAFYNPVVKNNLDLTFQIDVADNKDSVHCGIKNVLDMSTPNKGCYISVDGSKNITFNYSDTSSSSLGTTVANGTYYFRIRMTNYSVTSKTGTVDVWYKTSNPSGSWGTATLSTSDVDLDFTWYMGIFTSGSETKESYKMKNLFYINGGQIGTVLLSDVYNLVYDLKTKEWSEYSIFSGSIKQFPIEYMSPSKDRSLNSAQYLGCQYTSQVALYTDTNNYIGVFNQKGTTKDDSDMYLLSNPFNIDTPNNKILRKFYIDYTPTDAVVSLHLQNEDDFGDAVTSIMSVRSGWNTVPRTYRGRQFKWGITTKEDSEFQLKQVGFEFDDLGPKAF